MREGNQPKPPLPTWLIQLLGVAAAVWILIRAGTFLWKKLPVLEYSPTEKVLFGGMFVGMIAFVINSLTMIGREVKIEPEERGNFWGFVTGGAPADPAKRSLWRKMRRGFLILAVTVVFMVLGVAANWSGLFR